MKNWNAQFLERLLQVQDTDLKIRGLEHEIQVHYQKSKEEDAELSRLKFKLASIDETIEATESQYQMYSTTLDDIRTAIKGLLTTKSGAPKPRTRSSTEALKIEEEKLGTLVEETAEQLQILKEERIVLIGRAEARAKDLEKSQDGPEAEIKKLENKIRKLAKQREEEVDGMPPMLLKHYDRLRSSRSGIGLTILRDGVCTICRMQMPTAVISRMNKGERVPVCPACGRMVARVEIVEPPASMMPQPPPEEAAKKTKKKATKKAAAKKQAAKEAASKKAVSKKAADKKTATKKVAATKTAANAEPDKKTAKKKAPAKKTAEKKAPAKKAPAKKTAEKKVPAKKTAEKKAPAKKAPAKKTAEKKAPAKKAPAKKTPAKSAGKTATKKSASKTPASKKAASKKTAKKK